MIEVIYVLNDVIKDRVQLLSLDCLMAGWYYVFLSLTDLNRSHLRPH